MTQKFTTCVLCGITDPLHVKVRLVDWKDPHDGRHYGHIPRCDRTDECRARVILSGEAWEVRDPSWSKDPTRGPGNLGDSLRELGL